MGAAWLITLKDLRLRTRDRSVFLFAFVVPIGLAFLFSTVLPSEGELSVTAALVDEDGGDVAASFGREVLPSAEEAGFLTLAEAADREAAQAALRSGDLDAAWVIPEGFSEAVGSGQPVTVDVLVSPDAAVAGEVARGLLTAWTGQLEATTLAVATVQALGDGAADPATVAQQVVQREPSVALVPLLEPDRQLDAPSYLAAGMAAFFVFFTVQFGVTGLLEERRLGTLPRLLAAPISPWAIQYGKAIGAALLGVVSMAALAGASHLLLGADWGPVLGVTVLIVAIVAAAIGLMALVGTFAQTAEQAGNLQSIVAIVLGMLGGVFIPLPSSGFVGTLSNLSPHGWFLRGIADQAATDRWTDVLPAAGAILLFGIVAALPAVWRMRKASTW